MSSVECHIFLSDDAKAKSFDSKEADDCYSTDTFISMTLAELWAIMQGRSYELDLQDQFAVLVDNNDGEFTIERFPQDLVERLSNLTTEQKQSLAESWSTTEENEHLPAEVVAEMLDELVRLSKEAKQHGKNMYICNEC